MSRLNKKVLVLVDESGTAGEPDFMLGAVAVAADRVAELSRSMMMLRPTGAGEAHAVNMSGIGGRKLVRRIVGTSAGQGLVLVNKASAHHVGTRPEIYAAAVIEIVKVAIQRYARRHHISGIGNIELILDRNEINAKQVCLARLQKAKEVDGRFKAVQHIAAVDSAAVPFLQLADLVAYSRRWRDAEELDASQLRRECGIELL